MIQMRIIDIYTNWDRDKDYLDLNLATLRKLINLNEIVNDDVLNKINNVAFFLRSNDYEKLIAQYLNDLKSIVNAFEMIDKYFQSQKAFNIELSSYYNIPTKDNPDVWREHNQDTIKNLNDSATTEQKAFYSMVREVYQYGVLKKYQDKKITTQLEKLKQLIQYHPLCKTSKCDSEIVRFFEMKYKVEQNHKILKVGMQDLYNFFDLKFREYGPIDFCNEILEHIFDEKPKQKRYFIEPPETTHQKINFDGQNTYQISNIKK